jgi:hypothetical protein
MESNDAARAMFDTLLENCIFYISPMYEFLHSQGQSRRTKAVSSFARCPLRSESGHEPAYLNISASCQKRTFALQQISG